MRLRLRAQVVGGVLGPSEHSLRIRIDFSVLFLWPELFASINKDQAGIIFRNSNLKSGKGV